MKSALPATSAMYPLFRNIDQARRYDATAAPRAPDKNRARNMKEPKR
jgi:hypothetical protein